MSAHSTEPAWRLKDLSAAEYSRLSELLDSCLALPPAERTDWLSRLEGEDLRTAGILRRLLATSGGAGFGTLVETGEVLTRHLASLARGEESLIGSHVGPYRVLSLLGQGGMGSVWLAERADGLFARKVALKLVHPVLMGRRVTERFAREREILAGLSHSHIARLLDAGITDAGQPFLALEYVAGKAITVYCDERQLSVNERLQLFLQVLSAVQYAHAHLIIHRDLKPSNILVTEQGEVQLLDFGIAKLLTAESARETELTQLSGRALTPDYAAPEQIAGEPITTAADVYALGVILYELLTGERPYRLKRDSRGALEEAILATEPMAPSRVVVSETVARARATSQRRLAKALRGDLDTITTKALKKSPSERYATANAFGEDIARFLHGEVVLAQRDSVAYRAWKFARRHRVGIAAVGVLITTLATGLAATTYEAKVAATQRDAALQAQLRSLTQTAAARLKDGDVPTAMGIILEVIRQRGRKGSYTPEALSVFQEARTRDAQVLALVGHSDRVRSLSFSPDGRRIATGSYDKTARIWDSATGRQLVLLRGHTDRVASVALSPDGLRVVTGSGDHTARIWDAQTGRELMVLAGHADRVSAATFAPDGHRVVTASHDRTARVWDAITGRQLTVVTGHTDQLSSVAFAPDGTRIATGSLDKTARIWDVDSGRQIALLSGHTGLVTGVTFSPDGRHVATASTDQTARIWDADSGQQQMMLVAVHPDRLRSVSFSPDGQRLITTSDDKTARIWDAAMGRELTVLSGHTEQVSAAAFAPDGKLVATASDDTTVRIWDSTTSREIMRLAGHADVVPSAAFSPDGRRVVTASNDKTARVWDYATGREVTRLSGHTDLVESATFSPDGKRVVTASNDKTVRVWDALSGREIRRLVGHTDRVWTAVFSHDGQRIVTASSDRTARIWNATTGQQTRLLTGHADLVSTAVFSPDDLRVVTASDDATARVWDAATGRQILILTGHTDQVPSAAFSPDGRRIITSSDDQTARIWNSATGQQIVVLSGHSARLESASFSADGQRVITASDDKTARIWDAATGQQMLLLGGHTDAVETATFSGDGDRALTASADGTARIWDARTPSVDAQIGWAEAARFDSLSSTVRFQLGLPPRPGQRAWPVNPSRCDESAAAPYDPDRRAAGVTLDQITTDIAVAACTGAGVSGNDARSLYQQGRALMASGDFGSARRSLEEALARGYRAAHIELAMLLSQPRAGMIDVPRALSLYEQGWHDGVTIAAFELGSLYEYGVSRSGDTKGYLAPDGSRAWTWYQKSADTGGPTALARFGERADQAAFAESDPAKRNLHLLEAFKYYAAAAERARTEDWPDDAWRNWRYRRASLARVLARAGMMQEVADAYDGVRRQYSPASDSLWHRVASLAGPD